MVGRKENGQFESSKGKTNDQESNWLMRNWGKLLFAFGSLAIIGTAVYFIFFRSESSDPNKVLKRGLTAPDQDVDDLQTKMNNVLSNLSTKIRNTPNQVFIGEMAGNILDGMKIGVDGDFGEKTEKLLKFISGKTTITVGSIPDLKLNKTASQILNPVTAPIGTITH